MSHTKAGGLVSKPHIRVSTEYLLFIEQVHPGLTQSRGVRSLAPHVELQLPCKGGFSSFIHLFVCKILNANNMAWNAMWTQVQKWNSKLQFQNAMQKANKNSAKSHRQWFIEQMWCKKHGWKILNNSEAHFHSSLRGQKNSALPGFQNLHRYRSHRKKSTMRD